MAREDIEVRITAKGEIFIRVEGASEQRLRDFHAFLEEVIGPVGQAKPIERREWEKPAELSTSEEEERKRKHEQHLQQ